MYVEVQALGLWNVTAFGDVRGQLRQTVCDPMD